MIGQERAEQGESGVLYLQIGSSYPLDLQLRGGVGRSLRDKILREHPEIDPDLADERSAHRFAELWIPEAEAFHHRLDRPVNAVSIDKSGAVFAHSGMLPFQERRDVKVGNLNLSKPIPDDLAELIRGTPVVLYTDPSQQGYLEGQLAVH